MPYKSDQQRKKFHVLLAQGKISKSVVDEYDQASKGKKLPKYARKRGRADVVAPGRMN